MMISLPPKNSRSLMLPSKWRGKDAFEFRTFTLYMITFTGYKQYTFLTKQQWCGCIPRWFTHHTNKPMNESVTLLSQTFSLDCDRSLPEPLNASSPFESPVCWTGRRSSHIKVDTVVGAHGGNGGGVSKCTWKNMSFARNAERLRHRPE